MRRSRFGIIFVFLFSLCMQPRAASAACNSIPDAGSFHRDSGGPFVPYKGALGRIDKPYVVAGLTGSFTVAPDRKCVSENGVLTDVSGKFPKSIDDLLVVTIHGVNSPGKEYARLYAPEDVCRNIAQIQAQLDHAGQRPVHLLRACDNGGVAVLSKEDFSKGLRLPAVTDAEMKEGSIAITGAPEVGLKTGGVVDVIAPAVASRIAVMTKPDNPREIGNAIRRLVETECPKACETAAEHGLVVCVDRLYVPQKTSEGRIVFLQDPEACGVYNVHYSDVNNFREQCDVDDDAADTKLPKCKKQSGKLRMLRDECGGSLHIPFVWETLREKTDGTGAADRRVSGYSALSKNGTADGERIWIPGPEFLASTPISDPKGANSNPRKPRIDVDYNGTTEIGFTGTVDQDDSIVHIYPRLFVNQTCNNGEACYSADPLNGSGDGCACRDREAADCRCTPLATRQVFACDAGQYKAMPCTRPRHCPGGRCLAKPECHSMHEVWEPNAPLGGGNCWTDAECTGADQQCGYALFDLSPLGQGQQDIQRIAINAKISSNPQEQEQRGACSKNRAVCSNKNGQPPSCDGNEDCRGFTLHSGGEF